MNQPLNQPPATLSADDIKHLMEDRSPAAQMEVVAKLSSHYTASGDKAMTPGQNALADEIFGLLLNRAEVQVRAMMALNLQHSDKLPPDIARQMANDVQEVAVPIIEHSKLLTDKDLLEIISSVEEHNKLIAIAKRDGVSETISDALIEKRIEKVSSTLLRNETAAISEQTLNKAVEYHSESAEVLSSMLERSEIPVAVIDKVVDKVSDTMRQQLETKYGKLVDLKTLHNTLNKGIELTRLKMLGMKTSDSQLQRLIKYLDDSDKLPPFSALSMANLQLFEVSLARMLRISLGNVHRLLSDPNGLRAVYQKAALPEYMFEAVALCVEAIMALEAEMQKTGTVKVLPTPVQVMERMRKLAGKRRIEHIDELYAMMNQDWGSVW